MPGRKNASDITVFDGSGIAIQDINVARAVLNAAEATGVMVELEL